jgi:beta-N-acetylhexosaminidase
MAAHVAVPAIDGDRPASISPKFLTGILRDEWRFDGVCFTDCMQMDAIAKGVGTVRGVTEAIAAGADCALVSHDPDLAFEAAQQLAQAVDDGKIPLQRLQQAYNRVMRLRFRAQAPLDLDAPAPHPGIGRRIAREAVTLVRGEPRGDALADRAIIFGEGSLAAHAPALDEQRLALDPGDDEVQAMLEGLHASSRRAVVLTYRAHLYPRQAEAVDAVLAQAPDALVVSTGEPYDLTLFARARHVLAAYGNDEVSLAGLADVVFLGAPCTGVLPVALA